MILTGKCKEAFVKWSKRPIEGLCSNVELLSERLQNALIIDFFDTECIKIIIIPTMYVDDWGFDIFEWTECFTLGMSSRAEATSQAIIKANEIFNNNIN